MNLSRWSLVLGLLVGLDAVGQPLLLVTEDDVAREAAVVEHPVKTRSVSKPGTPKIEVISPSLLKSVFSSPLPIELKFVSAPDAEIDPATFRVSYGFLQVDITSRITQSVKVSKTGFAVPEAAIPKGSHRLVLQVTDSKGRVGESELKFAVE